MPGNVCGVALSGHLLSHALQGYSSGGTMTLKARTRAESLAMTQPALLDGSKPAAGAGPLSAVACVCPLPCPSLLASLARPLQTKPFLPATNPAHLQLPAYLLDTGKELRIDGLIPTDAAPRGGFGAEGAPGKLRKGIDYPPTLFVVMEVRFGGG